VSTNYGNFCMELRGRFFFLSFFLNEAGEDEKEDVVVKMEGRRSMFMGNNVEEAFFSFSCLLGGIERIAKKA